MEKESSTSELQKQFICWVYINFVSQRVVNQMGKSGSDMNIGICYFDFVP